MYTTAPLFLARKQKLYREQPFVLGVDAKELYPEEEDGELILIQGIIDAYFEEPDGLVVLDYKTDKVNNGKELAEKYQVKLIDAQKEPAVTMDCGGLELHICRCATEVDYMINVPVMKGHCQTKITCALKNMKKYIST